jgi:hypothetical protein
MSACRWFLLDDQHLPSTPAFQFSRNGHTDHAGPNYDHIPAKRP